MQIVPPALANSKQNIQTNFYRPHNTEQNCEIPSQKITNHPLSSFSFSKIQPRCRNHVNAFCSMTSPHQQIHQFVSLLRQQEPHTSYSVSLGPIYPFGSSNSAPYQWSSKHDLVSEQRTVSSHTGPSPDSTFHTSHRETGIPPVTDPQNNTIGCYRETFIFFGSCFSRVK